MITGNQIYYGTLAACAIVVVGSLASVNGQKTAVAQTVATSATQLPVSFTSKLPADFPLFLQKELFADYIADPNPGDPMNIQDALQIMKDPVRNTLLNNCKARRDAFVFLAANWNIVSADDRVKLTSLVSAFDDVPGGCAQILKNGRS